MVPESQPINQLKDGWRLRLGGPPHGRLLRRGRPANSTPQAGFESGGYTDCLC